MAATTIEWTRGPNGEQGYTFNPWWGCAEISPACAHCYARSLAKRVGHPDLWSVDGKRRFFGNDHWAGPLKLDARARHRGERYRVFCASMADVFDNHPAVEPHRQRLWNLIACTPHLDWLLLTKRIGNAKRMLPADWGAGYPNVWLGSTVVTQEEAARDIPKLLRTPARIHFLSIEPMVEQINLRVLDHGGGIKLDALTGCWSAHGEARSWTEAQALTLPTLPARLMPVDWVIAGGESGGKARPMHPTWVRSLRDQCNATFTPFLLKQFGEFAPEGPSEKKWIVRADGTHDPMPAPNGIGHHAPTAGSSFVYRVGKKAAGRLLDGRTWDQFPEVTS